MKLKWCYLICILALLFYGMAGTAYAQRVYATAQLNSAGSNSSISAATNSIDTDYTNSTLITVPGLIGGASWQQLIFPSTTVPAGSTVFIRLSSGTGLLGGNISYQAYKNATTSVAGTTAVTTTANFTDKNGNSFIAVTSSEAFNAVRITISGGLLATTSANIFYAFYEPPNTNCSTIAGTSTRFTGVALLGSISNPEYAIDESLTTASNFAGGLLGVGSELIQMVYFTNKSNVNDEVSITFSVPPAPLLALGLFNNVTLNVYNGTTLVSTGNVGSLLSLDLLSLLRNGKRQTVSFKPTSTFDRVEVVYATGVGLLNNFKLHEVARTPAKPTTPVAYPSVINACDGETVNISASSASSGAVLKWYKDSIGGTPVRTSTSNSDVFSPTVTYTPGVDTTFYFVTSSWSTGCYAQSQEVKIAVLVHPKPTVPIIPNVITCAGTSATLTVSSPVAGIGYRWYTVASGGTALTTANSYTVANPAATTTYYVEGYNSTTGCVSARTAVTLTVNPLPAAPTIPNVTTCAGTSATLTVGSPVAGIGYRWYTVASGGTALTTANSYTVANPTTTTTYYVEGYNSTTGCVSSRTAVTLTVNPLPAAPTIPNVTTCAGTSATLTVSSPVAGIDYRWYTVASGGTALTTANSYTVTNPTTTTTYYVEGYNTTTGCVSARTAVTLTVNPLPAAPTIPNVTTCAGTSATLTVNSPVAGIGYRWYTVASGGTALTTANSYTVANPTATTTYYVEGYNSTTGCVSARTAVTLTVNALPAAPTIANATTCAGTSATLTVSSPEAGMSYRWYTVASGGTALTTANSYTVANPTTTTTYYVEGYNSTTGCVSARTAVTLTVNALPAAPTIPNVTTCAGTSATLTVNSPEAGISYRWYTVASGGTALTTANNYTVANPTTTTTYYVEGYNSTTGCVSARTAVTLTVNPLPAAPTIPNVTTCAGTSATLTVSSPVAGIDYRWYTVASGGTALTTANSYTVANPTTTTTYYVEGYNSTTGCVSARTAVTLTVNPLPTAPTVPGKATCLGTAATLSVSSPIAGATYRWYTTSTGGSSFFTGTDYTITNPTVTVTYYVEASNASCVSTSRTAVTLTVNPLPVAPTVPNTATCSGTSVLLSVSSPVAGITYRWYSSAGGGTVLNTGPNYIISNPTVTTTYYVEAFNETTGCASSSRTAVTLTINPLPSITLSPSPRICEGDIHASLPYVVANGGNQYKITWDPGTPVSFQNVTSWTNLTGSAITVNVPANASYGVYTGKVSIYNSVNGCEGSLQSFSINIYPAQGKPHLTIQNIVN